MKIFFSENFSQNSAIPFSKYFSFQKTNFCRTSLIGWFLAVADWLVLPAVADWLVLGRR
jgi:hypothetical protein